MGGFFVGMGDWDLNSRVREFDYQRKADGSMPVGEAYTRQCDEVNPSTPTNKKPPLVGGFFVDMGDWNLNSRVREFDYQRKADGSMPVGEAYTRQYDEVNPSTPTNKKPPLVGGFFVDMGDWDLNF